MTKPNRLAQETSPYLQQHAENPVDWYPWRQEALNKARAENKPILLSIGYSACHWCHVMAHESFSDPDTAQLMNALFINIKVDKEERPDLDTIYQTLYQLLSHRAGGWPLTVFLSPQQHLPFFAGTYFPKEARYQLPSFKEVLSGVATFYKEHEQAINEQGEKILTNLQHFPASELTQNLNLEPWPLAVQQLMLEFDSANGGFGDAPKFPNPTYLELLTYDAYLSKEDLVEMPAWKMVEKTLLQMALGGIYDQIGSGFYRYSVDAGWEIPHFEKMLYDNAQLLAVYAQAYQLRANALFEKIISQTATWVMRHMQSAKGGYFSSINADSEGKEGHFYIWDKEEMRTLVSAGEYEALSLYFNFNKEANFDSYWHLHRVNYCEQIAQQLAKSPSEIEKYIASGIAKLYKAREKRVHPSKDEKILTSWNALMIKGMLLSGIQLHKPEFINSAERALNFLQSELWQEGRLLATYKDGKAHLNAYLDDYAFLLDAVLMFLQYRWRTQDLLFAKALADILLTHFFDQEQGGFFFVTDDHEALVYRPKNFHDGVTPSGNGIACLALQRLGYLLGETRYLAAVEKTLQLAWPSILKFPSAHGSLLLALQEYLKPLQIIIVRGSDAEIQQWKANLNQDYMPGRLIFGISEDEVNMPGIIADKKPISSGPIAYVCKGQHCSSAIKNLQEIKKIINN